MEEETKSTAPASGNDDSPASDQRQRIIDFGSAVSRSSRGNIDLNSWNISRSLIHRENSKSSLLRFFIGAFLSLTGMLS